MAGCGRKQPPSLASRQILERVPFDTAPQKLGGKDSEKLSSNHHRSFPS